MHRDQKRVLLFSQPDQPASYQGTTFQIEDRGCLLGFDSLQLSFHVSTPAQILFQKLKPTLFHCSDPLFRFPIDSDESRAQSLMTSHTAADTPREAVAVEFAFRPHPHPGG